MWTPLESHRAWWPYSLHTDPSHHIHLHQTAEEGTWDGGSVQGQVQVPWTQEAVAKCLSEALPSLKQKILKRGLLKMVVR